MKLFAYINGKTVPEEAATVSVFDRGLSYGDGLFETLKAVGGKPRFLKEHMKRLRAGAKLLDLDMRALKAFEAELNKGAVEELLARSGLDRGAAHVKIIFTRGADKGGHLPTSGAEPTRAIVVKELDNASIEQAQKHGVSAVFVDDLAPALPGIKSLNYLPSVMARMRAQRGGAYEAIFVKRALVTEGSSSNVFIVSKGCLITPPLDEDPAKGLLAGVTREAVIKLARKNSIQVKEAAVRAVELVAAQEAFLTNSIIDAVPLVSAGDRPVGDGKPGPVTRRLQALLKKTP